MQIHPLMTRELLNLSFSHHKHSNNLIRWYHRLKHTLTLISFLKGQPQIALDRKIQISIKITVFLIEAKFIMGIKKKNAKVNKETDHTHQHFIKSQKLRKKGAKMTYTNLEEQYKRLLQKMKAIILDQFRATVTLLLSQVKETKEQEGLSLLDHLPLLVDFSKGKLRLYGNKMSQLSNNKHSYQQRKSVKWIITQVFRIQQILIGLKVTMNQLHRFHKEIDQTPEIHSKKVVLLEECKGIELKEQI